MPTLPCSWDRVTGSRFTLMPEAVTTATKQTKYSIYEKTVFKALHTRQRRKSDPQELAYKQGDSYDCPAYCLERISRLQCREREPRQSPVDSLIWRDVARSLRRSRHLEVTGQSPTETSQKGSLEMMECPPWLLSITLTDRYLHVGHYSRLGKGQLEEIREGIRGSSTWCSLRASNSACSYQGDWENTLYFMGIW